MKSVTKAGSGLNAEDQDDRPTSDSEVGQRLSVVIGLYDTKRSAAKVAKTTPEMLARYQKGAHRLPFDTAARLAATHGVSLHWLATGEGDMRPVSQSASQSADTPTVKKVDEALLGNLIEGLEQYLIAQDLQLQPRHKARVIVLFYRFLERRRARLQAEAAIVPPELAIPGHPVDIAADPDLSDIVSLAE